jgi:hypothetical protein
MNENDLRTALHQHTEAVDAHPPAGWGDVEARASHMAGQRRARMAAVGLAAAVVIALLAVGVGALTGDDGPKRVRTADRPDETTTTESPTTTTPTTSAPAEVTSSTVPAIPDPESVGGIYPDLAEYQRSGTAEYADPVATATAFAKDYVGMKTPLAGKATAGAKPGTKRVSIRPNSRASLTTVVELSPVGGEGGPWTVTGSHTDSITLDDPTANDAIGSPTHLSGSALAFEGHVVVEVRDGGQRAGKSLGRTFVTGGGDIKRPFDGSVSFTKPAKPHGGLLLWEDSAEDGAPISATLIRVAFGGQPDQPAAAMSNDSRLRIDGIGGVRLGMDLEQARTGFGGPTVFTDGSPCQALAPQGDPAGLSVILIGNRVSLITVTSGPLKTAAGIAIGSTVAQVKQAYPGIDDRGTRLVLRGTGSFAAYSLVFEQTNGAVTGFWTGVREVAEADEACA